MNLEFKYPNNIFFIIIAIIATIFFILSFKKKEKIMVLLRLNYIVRFKILRIALLFIGLGLMVFSLLGPQVLNGYEEVQKSGMDIYLLMDTSKSMLVSDLKPDRISVAKKIVNSLLDNLEGDRVGFIPFASDAYIQMPLTDDYQLARMFLDVMDTDMISGGGTNLASAIMLANDSFDRTSGVDRVIIILSDGEEHDNASQEALKCITDDRVRIYTIGVGTEKGGLIPIYDNSGTTIVDYMKDDMGNPVTSRLNADTLKSLADNSKGTYYETNSQGIELTSLLNQLSSLERTSNSVDKIRRFNQLYQYFLGLGLVLFLIAWFLPEGRTIT